MFQVDVQGKSKESNKWKLKQLGLLLLSVKQSGSAKGKQPIFFIFLETTVSIQAKQPQGSLSSAVSNEPQPHSMGHCLQREYMGELAPYPAFWSSLPGLIHFQGQWVHLRLLMGSGFAIVVGDCNQFACHQQVWELKSWSFINQVLGRRWDVEERCQASLGGISPLQTHSMKHMGQVHHPRPRLAPAQHTTFPLNRRLSQLPAALM